MKRFFLLALGAYALAGSVKADDPQIMIHSTHAEEDARTLAFARARDQAALETWFKTLAQNALIPRDAHMRSMYNDWLKANGDRNAETQRTLAVDQLVDGDPVPEIGDRYDSEPMIKMYLHDLGYNEASDAQVTQIATYMRANHIHHVSQLGQ